MGIEREGYTPPEANTTNRKYEYNGKSYEVQDVQRLNVSDIGKNDRVFITTSSGNRYMIRWSKSLGAPKIYNEKDRFKNGQELYNQYSDGKVVAEIGEPMSYTIVTDHEKNLGSKANTTTVTGIEIRKDIDSDIESQPGQISMGGMASLMKDQFKAKPKL